HPPARLELDGRQVGHAERAVAGEPGPEEEDDVVAPADERRLRVAERLARLVHQLAIGVGLAALELDPAREVDAGPRPRRVQAVLDVRDTLAGPLDVGFVACACGRAHVEVAGRVDDDLREQGTPALLALEEDAAHVAPLDDRARHPGVQEDADALPDEQLGRGDLEPLGVDHRRPRDGVAEGAQPLAPVRDVRIVGRAPELAGRAGDRSGRQAVEELLPDPGDHLPALPVGHPVDPDHEPARREPAEVVVALDERHLRAEPQGRDGRRAAGRPAADDEDVGLRVDGRLASRLADGAEVARGFAVAAQRTLGEPAVAAGVVAVLVAAAHAGLSITACACRTTVRLTHGHRLSTLPTQIGVVPTSGGDVQMRDRTGRRHVVKLLVVAAALAALALGVATAGSGAAKAKKHVTIALFVAIQSNPVEQAIINNFNAVAKTDGAAKFVVFDSNNSVAKEIANCNDALAAKKFDAFALKAVAGPPLMGCARKALAAHIPVVVFGNTLGPNPNTERRQVPGLSASVIELARVNGAAVAKLAHLACLAKKATPCNVLYTYGPLAFDWASLSRKYFTEGIKMYKEIKLVATGEYDFDPNKARTVVKSLLQTHSDVDVISSDGDLGAFGAI